MSAIFVSYRREDTEGHAGRLYEALVEHFGDDVVFMDVTGIDPGRDFRKVIDSKVASCGVLLAVIGRNWLAAKDEDGQRRIDNAMDFVRLETISALQRDIPVIPVLVQGASMPSADQLPQEMKDLAFRNAVELTHARWTSDVQVLIRALERLTGMSNIRTSTAAAASPPEVEAVRIGSAASPVTNAAAAHRVPAVDSASAAPASAVHHRKTVVWLAMALAAGVLGWGGVTAYQRYSADEARSAEAEASRLAAARQASIEREAEEKKATTERAAAELRQREEAIQRQAAELRQREEASQRQAAEMKKTEAEHAAAAVKAAREAAKRDQDMREREETIGRRAVEQKKEEANRAAAAENAAREAAQRETQRRAAETDLKRQATSSKPLAESQCTALLREQYRQYVSKSPPYPHFFVLVRDATEKGNAVAQIAGKLVGARIGTNDPKGSHERAGCVGYRTDILATREGAECIAAALGSDYQAMDSGCSGSGFPYIVIPR